MTVLLGAIAQSWLELLRNAEEAFEAELRNRLQGDFVSEEAVPFRSGTHALEAAIAEQSAELAEAEVEAPLPGQGACSGSWSRFSGRRLPPRSA